MIAAATGFSQTKIEYAAVVPMLVIFGVAMLGVVIEAFVPRRSRYVVQVAVTLLGLLAAFLTLIFSARDHKAITAGDRSSSTARP